jgi:hypothetical protein
MKLGSFGRLAASVAVRLGHGARAFSALGWFAGMFLVLATPSHAESICAEVKIQISQKVSLERQAFEAVLKVRNGLEGLSVDNLSVVLEFTDAQGNTVEATSNQDEESPDFKFFGSSRIRVGDSGRQDLPQPL